MIRLSNSLIPHAGLLTAVCALAVYWASVPALAREPEPPEPVKLQMLAADEAMRRFAEGGGLIPAYDRDAERWLRRAKEAGERGDWKLAIDTLERVIRDHGAAIVATAEESSFRLAVDLAVEQIAEMPPEGLKAYRVLSDPIAKRLFEQALQQHDVDALREIADVYPLTSVGPAALDLLTAWLIDEHRPLEALDYLNTLTAYGNNRLSTDEVGLRRAVAFAMIGREEAAASGVEILTNKYADDDAFARRVDQVRRYLESERAERVGEMSYSRAWPTRMGPTGNGAARLPAPTFESSGIDYFEFPLTERPRRSKIAEIARRKGRPPIWQAVSDGNRLFVTCPTGLFALDLSSLEIVWRAFQKGEESSQEALRHRQIVAGFGLRDEEEIERLDEFTTNALYREYQGAVSTGLGLTFVINQPKIAGEQLPSKRGTPARNQPLGAIESAWANTLMAYESDSGRLAWMLGRSDSIGGQLADARFYCTPVIAGDELLVTYVRQSGDLYLGALDKTGKLLREVILGAGSHAAFPFYGLLEPTVANGRVYVPTGAGLLVAVRQRDFSPLWLASYEREKVRSSSSSRRRVWMRQASWSPYDEWLSSPPLVSQGRILLGADDSDDLICFNEQDGSVVWTKSRDAHRYLIGCDREHVYLGGKTVAAVSIDTGQTIWTYSGVGDDQIAGRPVLTENAVLVPTVNGVQRLSLAEGNATPLAMIDPGNLLALPGALYSIGPYAVAKLTDPAQAEQLVRGRLSSHPRDLDAQLQLAQLLMRQEKLGLARAQIETTVALAAALKDELPIDDEVGRSLIDDDSQRVAHTFVDILHAQAADEDDDDLRADLLQQAIDVARAPSDQILAGLALANHRNAMGDTMAASKTCLGLLFGAPPGALTVSRGWRVNGAVEIGRRLDVYWAALSDDEREQLSEDLQRYVDGVASDVNSGRLVDVADAIAGIPLAIELDMGLATAASERGDLDSQHFFLERTINRLADSERRDAIRSQLALAYLDPPGKLPSNMMAAMGLLQNATDNALADVAPAMSELSDIGLKGSDAAAVRAWLKLPLPAILRNAQNREFSLMAEEIVPVGTAVNLREPLFPITSFWDRERPFDPRQQMVPVVMCEQTRGISANAEGLQRSTWENDLPLVALEDENTEPIGYRGLHDMAMTNGVAALHSGHRVDAVGLTTGRVLWTPIPCDFPGERRPQPAILAQQGIVIIALDPETVIAVPARDGARPIWRRTWSRHQIERMCFGPNGKLILVDSNYFEVQVIDPRTGLLEREYAFTKPETRADIWNVDYDAVPVTERMLAVSDGMLAFANEREMVVRRIETGEVAWRHEADHAVLKVFGTDRGRFVLFSGQNTTDVLQSDNGTVETRFDAIGLNVPPMDLVIDRPSGSAVDRLMMFGLTDDPGNLADYVLESYPLQGKPDSFRRELGRLRDVEIMINPRMLRMSPDFVPVISNDRPREDIEVNNRFVNVVNRAVAPVLTIVSKMNDSRIGVPYQFKEGQLGGTVDGKELGEFRHKSRKIVDVMVLDHRILAIAPEGYFVLGLQESTKTNGGAP